jgi:hypothetical protein
MQSNNGFLFAAIAVVMIAVLACLLLMGVTKHGWRQARGCPAELERAALRKALTVLTPLPES